MTKIIAATAAALMLASCGTDGKEILAREIERTRTLARSSEDRFNAIAVEISRAPAGPDDVGPPAPPLDVDLIKSEAAAGIAEQRAIQGASDTATRALTHVKNEESTLDKIKSIIKTLSIWGFIALAAVVLCTTFVGPLALKAIRFVANLFGKMIPATTVLSAKLLAEKTENGKADATDHALITGLRSADKNFNRQYTRRKKEIRLAKSAA